MRRPNPDAVGNDLKIDSSNLVVGRVAARGRQQHLPDRVAADEPVVTDPRAQPAARPGLRRREQRPVPVRQRVRITVLDSAAQGEDLNLIWPSDSVDAGAEQREDPGRRERAADDPARARQRAERLGRTSRAGDNITLGNAAAPICDRRRAHAAPARASTRGWIRSRRSDAAGNTQVVAGKWIDITVTSTPSPAARPDSTGFGTVMHLHGTITPGPAQRRARARPRSTRAATATSRGSSATPTPTRSTSTRPSSAAARASSARTRRPARRTTQRPALASTRRAATARTSSPSTSCRRCSTRRANSRRDAGNRERRRRCRPHADARRPGRHRHLRRSTPPAASRASARTRSPARPATTT